MNFKCETEGAHHKWVQGEKEYDRFLKKNTNEDFKRGACQNVKMEERLQGKRRRRENGEKLCNFRILLIVVTLTYNITS